MPRPNRRPSPFQRGRTDFGAAADWRLWLAIATVASFLLFGGGPISTNFGAGIILTLGAACLLLFGAQGGLRRIADLPAIEALVLIAFVALPLLQLVPLPPALWTALPGRELEAQILAIAGQSGAWRPLTLDYAGALSTLALTLALGGVFLAGLTLPDKAIRALLIAVAVCGVLSILVGAIQLSTFSRTMTFYPVSSHGLLLGFMANRNHQALFIATGILVAGYLIGKSRLPQRQHLALFGIVAFVCFAAAFGTASRMGLALCLLASFAAPFLFLGAKIRRRNALIGGGFLALVLIGLANMSGRAGRALERYGDIGADYRWTMWERSLAIVPDYFPAGTGFGSFADVYQKYEKLDWLVPQYVNAAHNDYLQLVFEAGLLGLILMLLFAATFVRAVLISRPPDRQGRTGPTTLAKLGLAIIALILIHSVVDYPLRRPAMGAMFALALALVFRQQLNTRAGHRNTPDSAQG